jgi:glycosyltransferase involved in cell wall biosynthesis
MNGVDLGRLNIVHLIEPGSGGTMRHALDLARAQADISHNVTMIYSPLRLEAAYEQQLRKLPNVLLRVLPMQRAPHASDIDNLSRLIKFLRAEKPDILHAHSTKAGLLARLARLFVKTRVIYTPHAWLSMNPDMKAWQKNIYALYEKILSYLTDKIIVLSRHEYNHARALGIPARKLMLAQNGIAPAPPADRHALRAAQNIREDQWVVGFVGRLTAQKDPELAIRAFAKAQAQMPNLILYLIGDGELMLTCLSLAEKLGVAANIRWLGGVDARPHYAAMDLLLATSRYEGMPYSFLEAIDAGVPILTTDVGGCDSCIIEGQTGTVAMAHENALAARMVEILSDADWRGAMALAARDHAKHFTIPTMLKSVMAVYAAALGAPQP